MINIEGNKTEYLSLLQQVLDPLEFDMFKDWLEKGDFFTAPASTKYHLHIEGGLCQHSLNVYSCLKKLIADWNLDYSDTSVILVSLLHDICKVNTYEKSSRRIPPERSGTGKWETEEIYVKNDEYHLGHASKSLYIVQRFIGLTMEEIEAIHGHMGSTDLSTMFNSFDLNKLFESNSLAVCLHLADMQASYLMEDNLGNKEGY